MLDKIKEWFKRKKKKSEEEEEASKESEDHPVHEEYTKEEPIKES